jgi:putative ABC transport system permease protein
MIVPTMETLRQDLRFALRMARRTPGIATAVVLSVALCVGASMAVFALAWGVLLRPLPFPEPGRLRAVISVYPKDAETMRMSALDSADLERECTSFSAVGAYYGNFGWTLTEGGEAESVKAALVSSEMLPLLGIAPVLGRPIRKEEDRFGAEPVVLLGWDLWQRRFGGDPRIVGRRVHANGKLFRVIGVMPRGFSFQWGNEAWVPLGNMPPPDPQRESRWFFLVARLRPGVTVDAARREAAAVGARIAARHPDTNANWSVDLIPLRDQQLAAEQRQVVRPPLVCALAVLLIACGNIANLLLAHAVERRREIALRAALGAGPLRIARQLLTESLALALAGGALGLPLGLGGIRLLRGAMGSLPYGFEITADAVVLLTVPVVALAAGFLFGLVPALQACRPRLAEAFHPGAAVARGTGRLHIVLVVAEVALSTVLLVAAVLALRSLTTLLAAEPGFAVDHLFTAGVKLNGERYEDSEKKARQLQELVRRLDAVPGIEAAAGGGLVPLSTNMVVDEKIVAAERAAPGGAPIAVRTAVTAGLFRTLGVPLLAGRDFTPAEGSTRSRAVIVNATLARRLWPTGGAVGRRLRLAGTTEPRELTVIGVAGDIKSYSLRQEDSPRIYVSAAYHAPVPTMLLVRGTLTPKETEAAVRRTLHGFDPELALFAPATMEQNLADITQAERFSGGGLALFGAISLFFAAVGTYGVLAYTVGRRRREIGIRLALGAPRWRLFRFIVGRGIAPALAGLALGLLAAVPVARRLAANLYGVGPTDPISFAAVAVLFLDVAFIACYLPARRALEVDPAEILAEE